MQTKEVITFDARFESEQGRSAKIHIGTLSAYEGLGGGFYPMTAVKRMTAKEDFLKMPLKDRNCEVELNEDCRTRKLLEECDCVPWEVPGYKVKIFEQSRADYLSAGLKGVQPKRQRLY